MSAVESIDAERLRARLREYMANKVRIERENARLTKTLALAEAFVPRHQLHMYEALRKEIQ